MKHHATHLALCLLLGVFSLQGQVIVANHSVKATEISKSEVRAIFLGESNALKDGSHVVPVLLKTGQVHEEFLKEYIGKNPTSFLAGWRTIMFSGRGTIPASFDTESALLDYIASNPGAIGYIGEDAKGKAQKVKILTAK